MAQFVALVARVCPDIVIHVYLCIDHGNLLIADSRVNVYYGSGEKMFNQRVLKKALCAQSAFMKTSNYFQHVSMLHRFADFVGDL